MKPQTWTIDADRPLAKVVASLLRSPRPAALQTIRQGRVRIDGKVCRQPGRVVRAGQRLAIEGTTSGPPTREKSPYRPKAPKSTGPLPRVVYWDDDIVVVDKPPGMTTVRHKGELAEAGERASRFLPATLIDVLPQVVKGPTHGRFRLRAVHRLDRDTSGLVVVARTADAERHLGKQFRDHSVGRRYRALVRGVAENRTIESALVRDRGDGRRGSGEGGQRAVTQVRVVEQFAAGALVECELETGRTHQVRIHLGEMGIPLCGERIYDRPLHGAPVADASRAERPMLHAAFLEIAHPRTGRRMSWTSPGPEDFVKCLNAMR